MKTQSFALSLLFVVTCFLSGCWVVSLEPLASKDKAEFDAALLGEWKTETDDVIVISQGEDGGYDMEVVPSDKEEEGMSLHADLVRLGASRFLDCHLSDESMQQASKQAPLLLPTCMVLKVTLEGGSLRLQSANADWFEKRAKAGTLETPHTLAQGGVVLTGSTAQLQKFFEGVATVKDAWDDSPGELKRGGGNDPDEPGAPERDH